MATALGLLPPKGRDRCSCRWPRPGPRGCGRRVLDGAGQVKHPAAGAARRGHSKSRGFVRARGGRALALARCARRGAAGGSTAAWAAAQGDAAYVARARRFSAHGRRRPGGGAAPLLPRARRPEWACGVRAAELLRGIDAPQRRGAAMPRRRRRRAELRTTARLTGPPFTPQAYIDTDKGTIQIELAVLDAPRTVANFIALARKGYFDGFAGIASCRTSSCRTAIRAATARAGRATRFATRSTSGPTCAAPSAWRSTGRTPAAASSSSPTRRSRTSTARYTVFGQVVTGMDVVDALQQWDTISASACGTGTIGSDGQCARVERTKKRGTLTRPL